MDSSLKAHAPAFQKALDNFRADLVQDDRDEFGYTTLEDLQRSIVEIQEKHAANRKTKNMTRLNSFLEAMEQYGKVVEVFLNTSEFVAFIWGPTKFLLQVASTFAEAFDELLDVYNDIGESLPMLAQYESLFHEKGYMGKVLELIYVDVLKFHHEAYKYFRQRMWKQLFKATWKTFRSRFKPVLEDLRRHKRLVETQASLYQFEEIQRMRVTAEAEFCARREAEDLRRRIAVQDWLSAVNAEEDQEIKASVRAEYLGVCSWILDHRRAQAWLDSDLHSPPLLWINGIPGAGKTTIASYLVEHLREIPQAHVLFFYCRHEDNYRNSFVALARSMIGQSVFQNESLLPYVYEEAATSGEKPLMTLKRSQEILENSLKSLDKVYIIIDGLDECPPVEKKTIGSWFQTLVHSVSEDDGVKMRCLFLSQVDRETSKLFKGLPSMLIKNADLVRDIRTFCKVEGQKIKQKFALTDAEREDIIQKISHEAKGMFLYVKLVMKNLLSQTRLASLRKEMLPNQFPKGIDQAYGRIVSQILNPESTEREDAEQLLRLLVCAKRSLQWTEIQGAMSIELDTKTVDFDGRCFRVDSKDLCGSLVEIRPGGTVELVHMTAKHYLIHKKYISLEKEELDLSRLCLEYLSMNCFESGLEEHFIREFITTGHYAFAEYAIAYWSEHLLKATTAIEAPDLDSWAHLIDVFLKNHFCSKLSAQPVPRSIEEGIEIFKLYPFYDQLGQAIALLEHRKRSSSKPDVLVNNLDFENVLSRIRSLMEKISSSVEAKKSLERFHGVKMFKCSRIDCRNFVEGFLNMSDRHRHQTMHDRRFYCAFEGCVAAQLGFTSSTELHRHFRRLHDDDGVPNFPCYRKPDISLAKRAIEEANIPVLERFMQNESLKPKVGSVYSDRILGLWSIATRHPDDEVLDVLISHTNFRVQDILRQILNRLIEVRQVKVWRRLVEQELPDATDRWTTVKYAATAAISCDDVDTLRIVFSKDDCITRPSDWPDLPLLLGGACESGSLSCVEYLVSECGLDPFEFYDDRLPKMRTVLRKGRGIYGRRGPCYNAVIAGHKDMAEHLLSLKDNKRVSWTEKKETFLVAAAANGRRDMVEILVNHMSGTEKSTAKLTYTEKASLFDAIRHGKSELVTDLLPAAGPDYDVPDRNGCSMLMYAALNGLEHAVEHFLARGAEVNRRGKCPEVSASPDWGQTALLLATFSGHSRIVQRLLRCPKIQLSASGKLQKGNSENPTSDGRRRNVSEVAASMGHTSILQLLEDHKARNSRAAFPRQILHQPGAPMNETVPLELPTLD